MKLKRHHPLYIVLLGALVPCAVFYYQSLQMKVIYYIKMLIET